ncbi:MAG: phosphate/phosphite/phosphonate ABC transporter substrate-binding protein [Rhodocyclaceae bacterium]
MGGGLLGLAGVSPAAAALGPRAVRFGLTPAFLHDQHGLLADWRAYLQEKLGRQVDFILRDSYRETMDQLRLEKIDFAWICDYPFLHLKDEVRLMAVPLFRGRPYYRSYLIVSADNIHVSSILQLKGSVFAYADPYSNTGYLAPRYALHRLGENPERFFRKIFFTYSHRKVIEAVASGLAMGGAVDSYVWETLALVAPEVTSQTRVVSQSEEYGFPPLVAHRSVGEADMRQMQAVLLAMGRDGAGAALLKRFNLDGFAPGEQRMYDGVARMMKAFGEG